MPCETHITKEEREKESCQYICGPFSLQTLIRFLPVQVLTGGSIYQITPPEKMKQIVLVLFGTLRHTEQHTKSWTKTEHGKVKISDVKNMAANEQNLSNDGLVLLYFTVSNNGYAMTVVYDVKESS